MRDKIIVTCPDHVGLINAIASENGWCVINWGDVDYPEDIAIVNNEELRIQISVETRVKSQIYTESLAKCIAKDYHNAGIENVLIVFESGIMDITDDPEEWGNFGFNHSDMVTRRYDAAVFVDKKSAWTKYHPLVIKNGDINGFITFLSEQTAFPPPFKVPIWFRNFFIFYYFMCYNYHKYD